MAIITVSDQVALGISRLATIWNDKPAVLGLLEAYLENVQQIEDVYFELLNNRGLDSAIGAQLDVIGLIVGQIRTGENDDDYRDAIKLRIAINNSDGTEPTISTLFQQLSGATSVIFETVLPAKIKVTLVGVNETLPDAILADIVDVVSAGVGLDLIHGPGSVAFSTSNYDVDEDGGSVIVTINRNGGITGSISGTVQLVPDAPAVAGDFSGSPYNFSMADGVLSDTVNVGIVDNGIFEGDKTAQLSFINLVNTFSSGQATSQVTIIEDELETITSIVSNLNPTVAEGGLYTLTIQRTGSTTFPVTVDLTGANTGGAVEGTDYDTLPATLTIATGQLTEALGINILADGTQDPSEFFNLTISNPTVGTINGAANTATVTITDVAETSTVAMTVSTQDVNEGSNAVISVTRTGTYGACSVFVQTAIGTADATDFEVANKQVSWVDGESGAKTVSFTTTDDTDAEGSENFTATLNTPVGATISGTSVTTVTIIDDEVVNLDSALIVSGAENSNTLATALFTVELNGQALRAESTQGGGLPAATQYSTGDNWYFGNPVTNIGLQYEVRATETTAPTGSGVAAGTDAPLGTWLLISTARDWTNTLNTPNGFSTRGLTIEIRDKDIPGVIIDTMALTLDVTNIV